MIYLDNAATTKPNKEVLKVFCDVSADDFFNASAQYSPAFDLNMRVMNARKKFIQLLGGDEEGDNFVFTSGATESNNLAIFGSAINKKMTYLFSYGEHPSVFNSAKELYERGFDVKFVPLQPNGQVDYSTLENLMTPQVAFVSTMFVSNETGAVNDLTRIREIIDSKNSNAIFHIDAVQGFGKLALNLRKSGVNLCSISAHKIGGQKGVGGLYISKGTKIKNVNFGGGQEFGLRSGTVNASGDLSFLTASEIAIRDMQKNFENAKHLKQVLVSGIESLGDKNIKVVSAIDASPYVVSIIFEGNRGETIMRFLSSKGICVGTGSACSSAKVGNRVLENMGLSKRQVVGALRVSFGFENTEQDVKEFLQAVKECLKFLDK